MKKLILITILTIFSFNANAESVKEKELTNILLNYEKIIDKCLESKRAYHCRDVFENNVMADILIDEDYYKILNSKKYLQGTKGHQLLTRVSLKVIKATQLIMEIQ